MKTMKKSLISILILMLVISITLTGCKRPQLPTATNTTNTTQTKDYSSGTNPSAKKTIRVAVPDFIKDTVAMEAWIKAHNDINIVPVEADTTKLISMLASDSAPDIWRVNGVLDLPMFASRKIILPLDEHIKNKKLLSNLEDYQPIINTFRWNGEKIGEGPIYGFVKDWSIDTTLALNKNVFKEAGVPLPKENEQLTWDEIKTLSKKIAKIEQGAVSRFGFSNLGMYSVLDMVNLQLSQIGKSIWNSDFTAINLQDSDAIKFLEYWIDFSKDMACNSVLNPNPDSTGFTAFSTDKLGILMTGYWFNGFLKTNEATKNRYENDFIFLPSPVVEKGKRSPFCLAGTGAVVYKNTKDIESVMTFMEWFYADTPVDERAKLGWGLPMWKSKFDLLPKQIDFDKKLLDLNNDEIKYMSNNFRVNPYLTTTGATAAFDKNFNEVLYNRKTLKEVIPLIERDINLLINEGREQVNN